MEDTQLLKGILEGCILAIISREETYGYEIIQVLAEAGFTNLQEGTLYPILTRLEKKSYISCRKEKSPLGPIRKYYSVTEQGAAWLAAFIENYKKVTLAATELFMTTENP